LDFVVAELSSRPILGGKCNGKGRLEEMFTLTTFGGEEGREGEAEGDQ
jgi:hypothetical protein